MLSEKKWHMMRSRKVLAICVLLAGVVTSISLAYVSQDNGVVAQGDIEPPHLVSFHLEPEYIDTTFSSQGITVTIHFTDNLSGLEVAGLSFARYGTFVPSPGLILSQLISGTFVDGVLQGVVPVPQYTAEGRYYLSSLNLYDNAGNSCTWPSLDPDDRMCMVEVPPFFVNVTDSGPPATATPTPTLTPMDTPTATPDLIATQTAISNQIATSVAATLTALAPKPTQETGTPPANQLALPSIKR